MNDEKMELMIGHLLRIGVILAALVVAIGGVLYLHQSHGPRPNYASFHSVSPALRSPSGILRQLPSGNSNAIIQLGLLLLIATPIARVIFAAAGFSLERDWFYTAVSLLVLAVLMYSLFYGH
ncbi:DUF1634 domain-containing protein [Pseudacidobacterium ailaaui]|uniref:DUF1634 domain-containing protein n=1 Tax=Pseudacidobacterium ailaaui TaxID=1382359 RepID=UPI00047A8822|nr:DUF1634 domain-containing protein [Pseudacidobacterium ailaaui]MCL6464981.1 DUF1634 domain-containing protein [Pseudacidobacterium ailaaui]MDI3254122.1 DUF1634 domain-containing protein [Bacillota bacterium]